MRLNPYLTFNGQCEAAFSFYAHCLGGKPELLRHGEAPTANQIPAHWRDKIMHAHLATGDIVLMGSDGPADQYEAPKGFGVALHVDSAEEAERLFAALSENGSVRMPVQPTFWSVRFGMLVDQFGIPWMVNGPAPDA